MTEETVFIGLTGEQLKIAIATGVAMAFVGFFSGIVSIAITNYVEEKVT